jgi:HK97 gp10 family phage protein
MKTTVKFEGGRELERALGELGTLYRRKKAARDALLEGGEVIRAAAEAKAPVRSGGPEKRFKVGDGESRVRRRGALRLHVGLGTRLNSSQRRANAGKMPVEAYVGTRDRAGRLQEFGTQDAPAQPWLRPAWDATKMMALEVIKAALWRQISRQAALQAKALKRGRK